jgi:hypothetical protein
MKIIKKTQLHYQKGTSNKLYNVYLVEISSGEYLVNFEYGRYGAKLKEGTKTKTPLPQEKAQKVYDSLVVSKINKEYHVVAGYNSLKQEEQKERDTMGTQEYEQLLLSRLQRAQSDALSVVDNYQLSRLVYKAGSLKIEQAKPIILALYASEVDTSNAFYYAVAWALGRYRDSTLRDAIESLRTKLEDASRYIVDEALLLLQEPQELGAVQKLTLPTLFASSFKSENLEAFTEKIELLEEMIQETYTRYEKTDAWYENERKAIKRELMPLLQRADEVYLKLYLLTLVSDFAKELFGKVVTYLPITKFNFSLFRRLYKMAQMRDDYEILAELVTKIESKKMACYMAYDENWSAKPSLGCSRLYFKKRSLRYLESLAAYEDTAYIAFSKNILLSMNRYPTEFAAFTTEYYDADWNHKVKHYDAYAVHLTFMSILFGGGEALYVSPKQKSLGDRQ